MTRPMITIEGGKELRAALKRIDGDLSDLKDAHLQVAAQVIQFANATGLTPVRTGRLKKSQRPQNLGASAGIRVKQFYAPFVYFGTRSIRANPWLRTAAERSQHQWLPTYEAAVAAVVAKAVSAS